MLISTKLRRVLLLLLLFTTALTLTVAAADAPRSWSSGPCGAVTLERISSVPKGELPAWKEYWKASQQAAGELQTNLASDFSPPKPIPGPPKGGLHSKGLWLDAPAAWYASAEAQTIADRVVARQSAAGAWTKGNDYTQAHPPPPDKGHDVWDCGTFDNEATTYELRFLALANAGAPVTRHAAAWRKSFLRGLRYVFAAQYPNGGFPQVYPLVGSYHDAVTFNDDAMTRVLELLRDVAAGKQEFAFVPVKQRKEAGLRIERGVRCILAAQLKAADGRRTVWAQQYDVLTLQPCAARNFEPVGASGFESASITRFLMGLPEPSPEVVEAVNSAVAWFRRTSVQNIMWNRFTNDAQVVVSPGARPLWARLYELDTEKPIFGDRDRTIHYAVAELSDERRAGYTWYGAWPSSVLEMYETWRKKTGFPGGKPDANAVPGGT